MDNDLDLIRNIKEGNEEANNSIKTLSDRHTGIFFKVINRFTSHPSFPNFSGITKEDLVQEKDSIIYDAALSFKEEKGVQFNTYLGHKLKYYLCNKYNSLKHEFLFSDESQYEQILGDEDVDIKEFDKESLLTEVFHILEGLDDKRIERIFRIRYKGGNKLTSWKQVEEEMNHELTYERCRSLHNETLKLLRARLKKN